MKVPKVKWKHYKFVPEGSPPDTRGICYGDAGFLELCKDFNDGRDPPGYRIRDTKFKPGHGGRNVAVDWTGFKEALRKEERKNPRKPSVFWWDPGSCGMSKMEHMQRQMLWTLIQSYSSPGDLAVDILKLLAHGPEEELESFIASVHHRRAMVVFRWTVG